MSKCRYDLSEDCNNKDCLACVLDKIRAEIEHLTYYWCEINPKSVIDDVLQIIDKYKAESEGEGK